MGFQNLAHQRYSVVQFDGFVDVSCIDLETFIATA
jgi:hypothetical protein